MSVMRCSWRHGVAACAALWSPGAGDALAGAWPLGEGEALVIGGGSFSDSAMAFDAKGKLLPVSSYRKFNLGLYIEYGATERVTLVAKPVLANVRSAGPPAGAYHGLEALEAGARVLFGKVGDAVFSAQATVKIPGSSDVLNPALVGSTAVEAEGRLLAGYSFQIFDRAAFVEAQAGWRAGTGGNPGEARLDLTIGARPFERVLVLLQSFNLATTGAGTWSYPNQRMSKLQPSVVFDIAAGWSVQAGAFTTIYALNARREQGLVAAVWKKF
jgi:hypothetical protein